MLPAVVTVIVAGRDIAALAPAALDSLLAQTEPRFRAVLIDDGSVDETGAIFRRYADADPRFHAIWHADSLGLGAARNHGLSLVDTEFVAFLDADDIMRPQALEHTIASLRASGSDLAVGTYVRLRDVGGVWQSGQVQPWVAASVAPPRVGVTLAEHPAVVGNIVAWSKVSRHTLWTRTDTRFPEGVLYEDQVVAQRLYAAARGIDLLDEVLVEWRVRSDGTSITQREADPRVLADCVAQMAAGLDVLRLASPEAAAARTTQILRMDLPRLASIEELTPASRTELANFARTLRPTPTDRALLTQSPANPNDPAAPTVGAVYDRVTAWG